MELYFPNYFLFEKVLNLSLSSRLACLGGGGGRLLESLGDTDVPSNTLREDSYAVPILSRIHKTTI